MAKILYVYNDQVYANITNKCDCNCTFCIRKQFDGVGDADTLWHKAEPSLSEIIAAIDAFDFTGYKEFVFCGYGEPTCALENLIASARYVKEKQVSRSVSIPMVWETYIINVTLYHSWQKW